LPREFARWTFGLERAADWKRVDRVGAGLKCGRDLEFIRAPRVVRRGKR
jgi:hypothetical protein